MVFGWQKAPRLGRRAVMPPPSMPSAIAEDSCEVVPQFFPGYQPRVPAAAPAAALGTPQHAPNKSTPQRRAGSVRLAINTAAVQTEARPGDPDQQRSAPVPQSPLGPRRASRTSTASTTTLMSQQYEAMPWSSSCHYPAPLAKQRPALPFGPVDYSDELLSPKVRRASAIPAAQLEPLTPLTAVSSGTALSVAGEAQPDSYFCHQHGSGGSQGVSRSNSGSSTSTLSETTAVPSPAGRSVLPKHVSSLLHRTQRRFRLPLRRNHTTKTLSHNDLLSDDPEQRRLLGSRSTSYAEMPAYQQSIPTQPSSMRFSTGVSSPNTPACADASAPQALVESVRVDVDSNGDVRVATRLVPRVHNSVAVQMAYLPPRTSMLAVVNE